MRLLTRRDASSTAANAVRPGPPPPVVELVEVAKTYPGAVAVHALKATDLRVDQGDYLAVVGPSGSGKSTLLNILGLLDRPSSGSYRLGGVDVSSLSEADRTALRGRRIGFVFQSFHLLPYRTTVENVMLAQLYVTRRQTDREAAAVEVLERVGLGHRLNALPVTMSGGERQRVAIARALVNRPELLLCDEPTGNLDSVTANSVMELFEDLHREGLSLVVITHDPNVAARADRAVAIHDGQVTEVRPAAGHEVGR
jgi:putative ABC transport system ATP-binding protein